TGPRGPDQVEGVSGTTGGEYVIVLDQGGVRQRHAVIDAAAATHRVLLQGTQPGQRLAGVTDHRAGPGDGVHPAPGERGHAAQVAEQVECRAFGGEDVSDRTGHGEHDLPRCGGTAVRGGRL